MKPPDTTTQAAKPLGWARWIFRAVCLLWFGVALVVASLWAMAALWFDVRVSWLRAPLAVAFGLALAAVWILVKRRRLAVGLTLAGFVLVLSWWLTLQPSNDRDWQPDVALLSSADVDGNRVTLHNIRDCDYRAETDFDVRYYDKTLDLEKIRTADLFMVYWGSPYMAHTMVSFGFEGGDYICFSIEARKTKGQGYSAIKGLFRQFELVYIVADERDLVRLRTNYRQNEEAYLYRLRATPGQAREFFLDYVRHSDSLRHRPEWYSALTHNCTTSIRAQRAAADRAPWDWRMLVNGFGGEMLYERGMIATNLPFTELKQQCHINQRARAADKDSDFSRLIRQGLPGVIP